jgi:hypothetical protein
MKKERLWEKALYENDKALAKELVEKFKDNPERPWELRLRDIEYPNEQGWDKEGNMTTHLKRVLVELKILATFGKHSWKFFHTQEKRYTIY